MASTVVYGHGLYYLDSMPWPVYAKMSCQCQRHGGHVARMPGHHTGRRQERGRLRGRLGNLSGGHIPGRAGRPGAEGGDDPLGGPPAAVPCAPEAACRAPAPLSGGVVRALAHGTLARKRDPVPRPLRGLGGYVPAVPTQGLDPVALLAYVGPAERYTLLRGPVSPGFMGLLASRVCSDPTNCLRS